MRLSKIVQADISEWAKQPDVRAVLRVLQTQVETKLKHKSTYAYASYCSVKDVITVGKIAGIQVPSESKIKRILEQGVSNGSLYRLMPRARDDAGFPHKIALYTIRDTALRDELEKEVKAL